MRQPGCPSPQLRLEVRLPRHRFAFAYVAIPGMPGFNSHSYTVPRAELEYPGSVSLIANRRSSWRDNVRVENGLYSPAIFGIAVATPIRN
jgi:hypothetical protein